MPSWLWQQQHQRSSRRKGVVPALNNLTQQQPSNSRSSCRRCQ